MSTLTRSFWEQGGQCRSLPNIFWIAIKLAVKAREALFSRGDPRRPLRFLFPPSYCGAR